ncbi:tetratricopeptide repeat protein [Limnobacter humi]|uniref:Tetratricopeptide repeat protein n=1 Tax=Limnobacter humi TaxID=1778671 RepID=A0ABT1WE85_9BURK|nr:tetratricopeptide repeat protein [Limnobacter humi]MCQ8895819.1 tetratricopeptide repeat protein [Limnobacter humi]
MTPTLNAAERAHTPPSALNPAVHQAVQDMTPLKGKNALVVDSALATRRALQDQLSQLGARSVVFASSVSEVEQQLLSRDYSLIVCEYQLEGERNGQQLLEDLRVNRKLDPHVAFMMVTGERSYANVVAVAEFEPDDYLIKPFTASTLSDRVVRIFNKKLRLSKIYSAHFEGRFEELPALCLEMLVEYPQYSLELERVRIESYFRSGQLDKAEAALKEDLEQEPRPWMKLLLAKLKVERKRYDEAGQLLSGIVKHNPEYLAASDLFADVLWEQNRPADALDILEKMGAKALASTTRLRKLADLSVRVGDNTRSKNYLNKVIDRSRNTSLSQLGDYLQLSKIYVAEGRVDEAEKLTAKLRSTVSSSALEIARAILNIQRDISDDRGGRAKERLHAFFEEHTDDLDSMEPETLTSLLEMCFSVNIPGKGYELARLISKRKPSKGMLDRIRVAIEAFKQDFEDS